MSSLDALTIVSTKAKARMAGAFSRRLISIRKVCRSFRSARNFAPLSHALLLVLKIPATTFLQIVSTYWL